MSDEYRDEAVVGSFDKHRFFKDGRKSYWVNKHGQRIPDLDDLRQRAHALVDEIFNKAKVTPGVWTLTISDEENRLEVSYLPPV